LTEKFSDDCQPIKHENMMLDPLPEDNNINNFLGRTLSETVLIYGIQETAKEK
jgi:hypothetical protein